MHSKHSINVLGIVAGFLSMCICVDWPFVVKCHSDTIQYNVWEELPIKGQVEQCVCVCVLLACSFLSKSMEGLV